MVPFPLPQGKALGIHSLWIRIAGQLRERLGPAQTTYFLFSESEDPLKHTCAEKFLGDQTESDVKRCSTHRPLW